MTTLRRLAFGSAATAYAVIVLGFIVRITGSGMGCGDDWPLCNGRIIPPLDDVATLIEWGHRLSVLALSALTFTVLGVAVLSRADRRGSGPHATLRPALLAVVLLVAQALIGALAVKLELPAWTVILHLGVAMALLATLMVVGFRAGAADSVSTAPAPAPAPGAGSRALNRRGIIAAGALGAATVLLGAVTANLGAALACQGFPLCSGTIWPAAAESGLPQIHWIHRLLAYALFFHLMGLAVLLQRGGGRGGVEAPKRMVTAAWVAFGIAGAQVAAGAVMVLLVLPPAWRTLHAALGTAVWVALVYLVWVGSGQRSAVSNQHP